MFHLVSVISVTAARRRVKVASPTLPLHHADRGQAGQMDSAGNHGVGAKKERRTSFAPLYGRP